MSEKSYYDEYKISNSFISWFDESPAYAKKKLDNEIKEKEKVYQRLGKKLHNYILEEDDFNKNYIYLEFDTPKTEQQKKFCEDIVSSKKKKDEKIMEAYKNNYSVTSKSDVKILEESLALASKLDSYLKYLKKVGKYKDILNKTDWELIQNSKKSILEHELASSLLFHNEPILTNNLEIYNEFPIFWEIKSLNLECKSLLDRLIIDHENKVIKIIDLKTTNTFKDFKDKIIEFNYLRQLAFYTLAVYWYFVNKTEYNIEEYRIENYIIGIRKTDPVETRVYKYGKQDILSYIDDIQDKLKEISWHFQNEKWDHSKDYYENQGIEK